MKHLKTELRCLIAADDGSDLRRGKVSRELIPQENELEEFLRGATVRDHTWITHKRRFFSGFKKVSPCTWRGITCDKEQNIISIIGHANSPILEGNLSWSHLPRKLTTLVLLTYLQLQGDLPLDHLPHCLNRFQIFQTRLSGTVSFIHLPLTLKNFKLNHSKFFGEADLATLPHNLGLLGLRGNKFTGSVQLTALPPGLRTLDLALNQFTGLLDLGALPQNLVYLNLASNNMEGPVVFPTALPASMEYIGLFGNSFSGYLDLSPILGHKILARYFDRGHYGINLDENEVTDWGPKSERPGLPNGLWLGAKINFAKYRIQRSK